MSKPNFKITPLKTLKERFRDKFGKDLITWDETETEAGPEPDERLFNEVFKAFSGKEDANDILNSIDKSPLAQEIRETALGTLFDIMDFFDEENRKNGEYTEIGMYINK